MSQSTKHQAPCPGCGRELEFTLWQSINTETENAREDIISGRLFDTVCPDCGYKARVDYPMLFSDLEHNSWIWYYPEEGAEDTAPVIKSAQEKGVRCRLVHTQEALSEKAAIFSLDLDDRIVEVMKLAAGVQVNEALPGCQLGPIIFALNNEGKPCFLFRVDGKTNFMDMYMDEYEEFSKIFGPMLSLSENDTVIDTRWALNFMGGGAVEAEAE